MKQTVYIETSIPSFFYETRKKAEFVAMRQWTRDWWQQESSRYRCVTSDAVINQLEAGNHPEKNEKLKLLNEIELLEINYTIEDMITIDTIEEIRKTRREISRKCDFDPRKLVDYYLEKQRKRECQSVAQRRGKPRA